MMNRRSVLSALAAAPLAVLPKEARASQDRDETFDRILADGVNKRLAEARDEWNDPKVFHAWADVDGDFDPTVEQTIELAEAPYFRKIEQVVHSVTKTPDIFNPTYVYLFDDLPEPEKINMDTALFFKQPAYELAVAVMRRAIFRTEGVDWKHSPPPYDPVEWKRRRGAVLASLRSIHFDFMYYGPTPYPNDGKIRRFDYDTNSWVTARPV